MARRASAPIALGVIIGVVACVFALNFVSVGYPAQRAISSDDRNDTVGLDVHYRYFVDPSTLVLDLRKVEGAAPVDLFRALFEAAAALHKRGAKFETIILARNGRPVFQMSGEDFDELGTAFDLGENPIYLMRTLPEKLHDASGHSPYGKWEGGWLGVLGRQMEDANAFALQWARGNSRE